MKILILACSLRAYELMRSLSEKWKKSEPDIDIACRVKCSALGSISARESIYDITAEFFGSTDALVFISAAGIAVRSIAPLLSHKSEDPAVIVIDECGKHCIPLLSGHYGGANELALKISGLIGAEPVITTATDIEGRFAVDSFALKNKLVITDWKRAKEISAGILQGRKFGIFTDCTIKGKLPEELFLCDIENADIIISHKKPIYGALWLIPPNTVLGIGCKKGTAYENIKDSIEKFLNETGIAKESIYALSSIDIKRNEEGIETFCKEKNLPFALYSAQELKTAEGSFTPSPFVEEITGVDNVCERSAVLHSGGELICRKRAYNGVTLAAALRKGAVSFE